MLTRLYQPVTISYILSISLLTEVRDYIKQYFFKFNISQSQHHPTDKKTRERHQQQQEQQLFVVLLTAELRRLADDDRLHVSSGT